MRWVAQAVTAPARCAVLPYVGATHELGFIDTGSELPDGGDGRFDKHIYVSVVGARELARVIGYVDPADLEARVAELEALLAAQAEELALANRQLDAIDVMESADFRARRKPGRPAKQREEVAA